MRKAVPPDTSQQQEIVWSRLFDDAVELLARYGKRDDFGAGDYLVVDDNYGWHRISVEIHNLRMLQPEIVKQLRAMLTGLDGWEIVVAVHVPGHEKDWPRMGLTIRQHEVIDGLQRQFLPTEFSDIRFEGGRPGTGND